MKLFLRNLFSALSILLLFTGAQSAAQSPRPDARPRTASIGGRVTVGGAPAANALVTVVETDPESRGALFGVESPQGESFEVRTDSEGRYRIAGLPEGSYVVRALSKAYVLSKGPIGVEAFRQLTLDEGESRDGLDITLVRGGVITGRVIDAEGKSAVGIGLRLLPLGAEGRPQRSLDYNRQSNRWMFQTDDRGVYRIYGLIAGRYIISAGGEGAPNLVRTRSPETFYPDTTDSAQAKIIEVKEGAELSEIDIRLSPGKDSYDAAGRVVDADTGKPVPQVTVLCMQAPDKKKGGLRTGRGGTTDDEGRFTCAGLAPGPYDLSLLERMQLSREYYSEKTRFEVTDANLSGLEVKAIRGSTISGVVLIEGAGGPPGMAKLQRMSIELQVEDSGHNMRHDRITAKIATDGGFRLTGAPGGMARFYLEGNQENAFFIRRVERDGAEIRSDFEIGRGEQIAGFRVIVAQASGMIRGQVDITSVNLPESCQLFISASPIRMEAYSGSSGSAVADEKGRFVIEKLIPGEYELRLNAMVRESLESWSSAPGTSGVTQRVAVSSGSETVVKLTLGPSRK
ncbi:MAG TPA: carboxypeptidase regulatory-like domain-containing protein [Blastocatellia bacterium]|jgi:hypothetical protein|nr:carboxypeptidase regulatory-like domain-containing protein [Blastocatellia bacterium]